MATVIFRGVGYGTSVISPTENEYCRRSDCLSMGNREDRANSSRGSTFAYRYSMQSMRGKRPRAQFQKNGRAVFREKRTFAPQFPGSFPARRCRRLHLSQNPDKVTAIKGSRPDCLGDRHQGEWALPDGYHLISEACLFRGNCRAVRCRESHLAG